MENIITKLPVKKDWLGIASVALTILGTQLPQKMRQRRSKEIFSFSKTSKETVLVPIKKRVKKRAPKPVPLRPDNNIRPIGP